MNVTEYMKGLGEAARRASREIAAASTSQKNDALLKIASLINQSRDKLAEANQRDIKAGKENGLSDALIDRLELTPARIDGMIEGLNQVAALNDPVGEISDLNYQPSGIQVGKMRVPLGVVGIIYESRPNVTVEAASLCLKSGNATILRGGSEALQSNQAIADCVQQGLVDAGLSKDIVQVLEITDRAAVGELITMPEYVDVIVPRGGKGLIERISSDAKVPVIKHLDGNCHVYIDSFADIDMALEIAVNAKTQRYGTCNTAESLLIHVDIAARVLPDLLARYQDFDLELRVCDRTKACIEKQGLSYAKLVTATEDDWYEEYLAPILAVKIVDDIEQAIEHINHYSSAHSETIVSNDYANGQRFIRNVDSSSVMINASTRFADGFEYGLGAEIGISTDKIHARGPVGLHGLMNQKYVVLGNGHIRQ